jgi:hypothetical protein
MYWLTSDEPVNQVHNPLYRQFVALGKEHTVQQGTQGMPWVQGIALRGSAGEGTAGILQSCTAWSNWQYTVGM